jgi:methyl-accepting chemotaxis protein
MNSRRLPLGSGFTNRMVALGVFLSLAALAVLLPTLGAVFRLTSEQWTWFFIFGLVFSAIVAIVALRVQSALAAPIAQWLDSRAVAQPSREQSSAAFGALMRLPVRLGWLLVAGGCVVALAVSGCMALRYESWGLEQSAILAITAFAASFAVSIFISLLTKARSSDVCESLVRELPDPEQRRGLIRPIALRRKLLTSIVALVVVPMIFAVLLSVNWTRTSREELMIHWHSRLLDSLPPRPSALAIEELRARLRSTPLPVHVEVAMLEGLEGEFSRELLDHIHGEVAMGRTEGDSSRLPSSSIFGWRAFPGGDVILALSPEAALEEGAQGAAIFALLLLAFGVLAYAAANLVANEVSGATRALREELKRLASGDLRRGRVFESEDELGELSRSFELMASSLRETVTRVAEATDRVEGTVGELSPVSESVTQVTADQVSGIEQAASSMEEINAQVRGIAGSSQALNESVEESSSSILELGASGEELNETASLLSSRVEDVSGSIEQMVQSVKHVSENTETLSTAALETSASMEEMASSLRAVDASVEHSARVSLEVVESAEKGQAKVRQTIQGMEAIQEATDTAEKVIRSLHDQTEEIGAIVDVIDDVADETNLLALNAAIIAAQAGEHGRAFSVVADEIKDLAERVLTSTKEIGTLIGALQDGANNAIAAIERGSSSVASGVNLSAEAGMALEEITRASRDSGDRISGIVTSLREQAKAASHVVELMDRVRSGVDEIRAASAEQGRGNVVMFQGSAMMRDVSQQVRGTTEEQARGSSRIRENIENVRSAVEQINTAIQEQSLACSAAVEFLEQVRTRTHANEGSMQAMDAVTKELLRQAEGLRGEVGRFRF